MSLQWPARQLIVPVQKKVFYQVQKHDFHVLQLPLKLCGPAWDLRKCAGQAATAESQQEDANQCNRQNSMLCKFETQYFQCHLGGNVTATKSALLQEGGMQAVVPALASSRGCKVKQMHTLYANVPMLHKTATKEKMNCTCKALAFAKQTRDFAH